MTPLGFGDGIAVRNLPRGVCWLMEPKLLPGRDEENRGFLRDCYRYGRLDKVLICPTGTAEHYAEQFLKHLEDGALLTIIEKPSIPPNNIYVLDREQYEGMSWANRNVMPRPDRIDL